MDLFFGWTATALATYLAGCELFKSDIPTGDGTDVSNRDGFVSSFISPDNRLEG